MKRSLIFHINLAPKFRLQTLVILALQSIMDSGYGQVPTGTVAKDLLPLNSPQLSSLVQPAKGAEGQVTLSNGTDRVVVNVKAEDLPLSRGNGLSRQSKGMEFECLWTY